MTPPILNGLLNPAGLKEDHGSEFANAKDDDDVDAVIPDVAEVG
jgi:hypothetical protein